jgi:hypothetical protein
VFCTDVAIRSGGPRSRLRGLKSRKPLRWTAVSAIINETYEIHDRAVRIH